MANLNTRIRGLQIDDDFFGAGLQRNAGDGNIMEILVDDSSIEIDTDTVRVKASGITNDMLAGSIADSKLNQITTADKVDGGAITADSIVEASLDIHNVPSGVDKILGYTANGMEWITPTDLDTDTFLELTDTPGAFGAVGQALRVNAGQDALEFYTPTDVDEKVKADSEASAEYLDAIVDGTTLEITDADELGVIDASIGTTQLSAGVNTSLGKADSALQSPVADEDLVEDYVKENQIQKATFACDGIEDEFDVGEVPIADSVQVFLNGLLQESGSGKDYTLATDKVTFLTIPEDGWVVQIHSIKA